MDWNVTQYERFRDERERPFLDLLSRLPDRPAASVVDLGCGTGRLTTMLSDRWPDARVIGVDTSRAMLAEAFTRSRPGRLEFLDGDVSTFAPGSPVDVVVSNSALHWVPDHAGLIARIASFLAPGGHLALQMPRAHEGPSHRILADLCASDPWAGSLEGTLRPDNAQPPGWYVDRLFSLGFDSVDVWESVYHHVLHGDEPVLEWVKGTTLRPVLARLEEGDSLRFLRIYGSRLREAYPRRSYGTVLPFRRVFVVARKPSPR